MSQQKSPYLFSKNVVPFKTDFFMRKLTLYLLLVIVNTYYISAQNYNNFKFTAIDNTHGLLSDVVNCSYQDAQGFMWFGTNEGITRFDGYEFCNFKDHPHLGKLYGVDIRRITSDHKGNLLVSSKNGFLAFTPELKPYLTHIEEQLKKQDIFSTTVGRDSSIYISSNTGLYIIVPHNQEVKHLIYERQNKKGFRLMKELVEDAQGRLWLGAWGSGLLCLNKKHEFVEYNNIWDERHNQCAYSMEITSDQKLWVGTWHDGLYLLDISDPSSISTVKHFSTNNSDIPGSVILDLEKDPYNNIWVATAYGISVVITNNNEYCLINYTDNKKRGELSNANIGHIYSGNDDLMWSSSLGGGINKLHLGQNQFEHFLLPENEGQRSQSVYGFGKDKKGNILIGLKSLGFMIMDKDDIITPYWKHPDYRYLAEGYDINAIKCFLNYNEDWLLMGLRYHGLIAINQTTRETVSIKKNAKHKYFKGRDVEVMHKMANGNVLLGTNSGLHIIRFKVSKKQWHTRYIDIEDNKLFSIQDIASYKNNQYIIASREQGIYLLQFHDKDYRNPQLLLDINTPILSLYNEQDKYLWIGTQGQGLLRYDFQHKTLFNPDQESENIGDIIYAIEGDQAGNLWLTTNSGLTKLINTDEDYHAENFSHRDGLQSNIFIHSSLFTNKGKFYIGGHNGFNRFDPSTVESKEEVPPMVITEVKVEGNAIDNFELNRGLQLTHKTNTFSIRFSSLAYVFPQANNYAYKIEGIDDNWHYVDADMRTANYNKMPPGEYSFLLKASNSKGVWNDDQLHFPINVKRAPYKTVWAILIYIIIFVGLTWLFFRQRLVNERFKQEAELEQLKRSKAEKLNMYKLSFFTNMSHELLTPLAILSTTMDNIQHRRKFSTDTLDTMQRTVNNLNRLIKQLLTFRKVETGNMTVHYQKKDISAFVTECVTDFDILAQKKDVSFDIIISQNIYGSTDADKLELIIRNLLSNAFKYTAKGGSVRFNLEKNHDNMEISVQDTGCGIPEQEIEKLFSRYYRVRDDKTATSEGVGIGLNLTKSLINMMNGTIEVESKVNVGTNFRVSMPMNATSKNAKVLDDDIHLENTKQTSKTQPTKQVTITKQDFNILLVEDNDDFRTVLKDTLSPHYNVYEAINGIEGLEIAENKDIDLILSDIMMPIMDGNELCKRIKDNNETSHISVILLTAKVGDDNRKEGYAAGADSYLEKPVNLEMLNVRINSMLKQRNKLRHQMTSSKVPQIKKIDITPYDEKFFLQVKELVENNLDNTDFSVKDIVGELSVSNSMLYRKMKGLVGLSPSDYIRDIRLKHAAKMLENKSYSISEVAFSTGFNELSYFGLCFKKMYGVTPTAYQDGERVIVITKQ